MKGMIVKISNKERNQNNQPKQIKSKSSVGSTLLIIFLIVVIMVTSSIGLYAWAKYTSLINGNATAQVAKWSFKLVDGVTETSDVIEFAFTRTDGYEHVAEGRLAPGTFGEFEIGIDARGTETILEYVIEVELENKPTYLKFYKDEDKTEEIKVADDKFEVKGFMSLEDVKEIKTETIYWDWPYENGDDVTDTNDAGKLVTMQVSVTGYEVLEQSSQEEETLVTLADVVEVGDYVTYDASLGLAEPVTYTTDSSITGHTTSSTFSSSESMQWRVLSVDREAGKVELMSADPTSSDLYLSGRTGYINAEDVLNDIGAVYGHGKGATGGRSINLEDVEQYSSYDPYTYKISYSSTGYYGGIRTYTRGDYFVDIGDGAIEGGTPNTTSGYTECIKADSTHPVTAKQTYYYYIAKEYFENETIYNMLFRNAANTGYKNEFWLASRYVDLNGSSYCYFRVREVGSGSVTGNRLAGSDNSGAYSCNYRVVPVVSLESNILTSGKDSSGVWQLKVD